jgi:type II secretory pathway component PulK
MTASGPPPAASRPTADVGERGIALVMALIFAILLYILVAELSVSGRMVRATGENDALLARMRTQMLYQLADAEDQLLQDLAGQAAGGEGGTSPLGGGLPGAGGGLPGAGGEGGEEEDPAAKCDSSRDSWFEPSGHADRDLTTYVWIEDENRKFNILSLWSPDEQFAEFSRDRLVRLIDSLREDSEFDVATSDAQRLVQEILDWGRRPGTEQMPRPRLKSDDEKRREISGVLHLDELLLLPSMTEDLFWDKVLDGKVYLGLESVLTVWTSLRVDPGNPEKLARQRAAAEARGERPPGDPPAGNPTSQGGNQNPGSNQNPGGNQSPGGSGNERPTQPDGLGILINVNTAPRPVLRALFPPDRIPDRVIDAILEYRNEVDEEATRKAEEQGTTEASDFGDLRLGAEQKRKFFATTADLEQVEAFAQLPDPEIKAAFQNALTTKSEVFSIHLASLFKRNEEQRVFLLRRARSIVLRLDDGADGKVVPLVPFEERFGLRVKPIDLQQDYIDLSFEYSQMDQFAQEDRAWNPFLIDFYLPRHQRERFYQRR